MVGVFDSKKSGSFRAEVDSVPSSVFCSRVFGFDSDAVINGSVNVKVKYKSWFENQRTS